MGAAASVNQSETRHIHSVSSAVRHFRRSIAVRSRRRVKSSGREGVKRSPSGHLEIVNNTRERGGRPPIPPNNSGRRGTPATRDGSLVVVHAVAVDVRKSEARIGLELEVGMAPTILRNCLEFTPSGSCAELFRYYCPLCFAYFQRILHASSCCKNYICLGCAVNFVRGKMPAPADGVMPTDNEVITYLHNNELPCPHCSQVGFQTKLVSVEEEAKKYLDKLDCAWGGTQELNPTISPVRVGDDHDALRRKMLAFPSCHNTNNDTQYHSNSSSVEVHVDTSSDIHQICDDFSSAEVSEVGEMPSQADSVQSSIHTHASSTHTHTHVVECSSEDCVSVCENVERSVTSISLHSQNEPHVQDHVVVHDQMRGPIPVLETPATAIVVSNF